MNIVGIEKLITKEVKFYCKDKGISETDLLHALRILPNYFPNPKIFELSITEDYDPIDGAYETDEFGKPWKYISIGIETDGLSPRDWNERQRKYYGEVEKISEKIYENISLYGG